MEDWRVKRGWFLIMVLAASAPGVGRSSQEAPPEVQELKAVLRQFKAPEWKTRRDAFHGLLRLGSGDVSYIPRPLAELLGKYPDQADEIKGGLIQLLEKENSMVQNFAKEGQRFGEDYSNYYGDVIAAVSTLKDTRSINALVGAIATGGMAARGLAELGPASIDPVLRAAANGDPLVRSSALQVLIVIVRTAPGDASTDRARRLRIKETLLRSATDPDPSVRMSAATGLAALGDPDGVPVLERLAEHDPFFLPGQAEGGKDLYVVRNIANRALSELKPKLKKE